MFIKRNKAQKIFFAIYLDRAKNGSYKLQNDCFILTKVFKQKKAQSKHKPSIQTFD
jgi:hypothetical protein